MLPNLRDLSLDDMPHMIDLLIRNGIFILVCCHKRLDSGSGVVHRRWTRTYWHPRSINGLSIIFLWIVSTVSDVDNIIEYGHRSILKIRRVLVFWTGRSRKRNGNRFIDCLPIPKINRVNAIAVNDLRLKNLQKRRRKYRISVGCNFEPVDAIHRIGKRCYERINLRDDKRVKSSTKRYVEKLIDICAARHTNSGSIK